MGYRPLPPYFWRGRGHRVLRDRLRTLAPINRAPAGLKASCGHPVVALVLGHSYHDGTLAYRGSHGPASTLRDLRLLGSGCCEDSVPRHLVSDRWLHRAQLRSPVLLRPGSIEFRSRGRIHASHALRVVGESSCHSTLAPQRVRTLERDPARACADCLRLSHRPILFSPQSECAHVFLNPGDREMSSENGSSRLHNPWGFIVIAVVSATVVVAFGLGFLLLPRYQESRVPFSTKDGVYHALGFHIHGKAFNTIQPPLRVPTYIAWTETTIRQATAGDRKSGEFIATNCTACHGEKGLSTEPWVPSLAGLDPLVLYKQLDDFRSGTRLSGPMSAIAQSLTPQQYADVSAYFASLPGLPENRGERTPRPNSSYRNHDPVQRLIYAGDPKRGIAACASCHGPGGYRIGAPALEKQNELYIEQQLQAFAQGTRVNDMNMPMRTIAGVLTESEIRALARAYANENANGP